MRENGNIKKRKFIVIGSIIVVIGIALIIFWMKYRDYYAVSFDAGEEYFFEEFNWLFDNPDEYEFESLDAYYYKENFNSIGKYYFHAVYSYWFEVDDEWHDIDKVEYGTYGKLSGSFCLSWDSLEGFESDYEDYLKAVENGVHKSYTKEEIYELIEKYGNQE